MAKFKLALLVPTLKQDDNNTTVLIYNEDIFTNFNYEDYFQNSFNTETMPLVRRTIKKQNTNISLPYQESNNTTDFTFSFDENLTLGKNSQNTLTFKMLKYVQLQDERVLNPYAAQMTAGSLIRLWDKFNHIYDFIVRSVKYEIKNANVILNYECQDFFSYRHIRQNSGYTITNDENSEDFIGAQSINDWVNKICKECFISYNYIPLTDSDLNKTITFEVSNSNALNALITLGESQGFNLVVNDESKTFWYEPDKNDEFSGLYYSPHNDIQSLDVSQDGNSLTTILNVTGQTLNNIELTMLPEIPKFFLGLFNQSDWDETEYKDGFYTNLIQNKVVSMQPLTVDQASYNNIIVDGIKIPFGNYTSLKLDNAFSLYTSGGLGYSLLDFPNYTLSLSIPDYPLFTQEDKEIDFGDSYKDLVGKEGTLTITFESSLTYKYIYPVIDFCRIPTEEEKAFAEMADKLPWLENKLIDLSYFYNRNFITDSEYKYFTQLLYNDLRKVNGKLIYESNNYYTSLLQKTQVVADLQSSVDTYSADFYAGITSHLYKASKDSIKKALRDYLGPESSFSEEDYKTLYNFINWDDNTSKRILSKSPLLQREKLIEEYVNNYFTYEQLYFENLYKFQELWTDKVDFVLAGQTGYEDLTKGTFYHKYKNDNEHPILQQQAAIIATELQQYWDQAYTASCYCSWFLPRDWTNINDNNLLKIYEEDENDNAILVYNFMPQVKMFTKTESGVAKTAFNQGRISYKNKEETPSSNFCIRIKSAEENPNPPTTGDNNNVFYEAFQKSRLILENPNGDTTEQNIFWGGFLCWEENIYLPKKNYYLPKSGGLTWEQIREDWIWPNASEAGNNAITNIEYLIKPYICNASKIQIYPDSNIPLGICPIGGIYNILTYLFLNRYTSADTTSYDSAKQAHYKQWKILYENYGNFLLENSFTDSESVTSEALYDAAMAFFKDKEIPERQYGITVIDINSLHGYRGQQLKVTDQIRIATADFYPDLDQLKNVLDQPLFINQIEYSLRSDSDIKLTVNTVQYQDKMIRRLVKLIK